MPLASFSTALRPPLCIVYIWISILSNYVTLLLPSIKMITSTTNRTGANDADPPEYSHEVPNLELRYKTRFNDTSSLRLQTDILYSNSSSDIIIAVMGVTGSGKSTFIQLFSSLEVVVGESLESSTLTKSPGIAIWREVLTTIYSDSKS